MRSASSAYAGAGVGRGCLDELLRRSRAAKHVERDVLCDGQHPGAKVLAVLEPSVCAERPEERLLERVVGAVGAQTSAQKAEHLGAMLVVEAFERGDRHGLHHPGQTSLVADL